MGLRNGLWRSVASAEASAEVLQAVWYLALSVPVATLVTRSGVGFGRAPFRYLSQQEPMYAYEEQRRTREVRTMTQVAILESTRMALVKQRRVDARGLQDDHSYKRLDEFMKLQAAIEAVDKAIEDERVLNRP